MLRKHVILFDIDGTLVSAQKAQHDERRRYIYAIRDVTGKEPIVVPSRFAGMVDPQICKILLTDIGLDEDTQKDLMPKVLARMGEVYHEMKKDKRVLNDSVEELLRVLSRSPIHVLGVLTGNVSAVGEEKLTITGIKPYFSERFYADGYYDRNRLVEDAVEACVAKYHLSDRKSIMIVGDTPLDMTAANTADVTSMGIASGIFSMTQLSRAGAKLVFPDLKPSKGLLRAFALRTN